MWVKICGITNVGDALAAADAGADAIGLNFVSGPRKIDVPTADEILRQLPAKVTPVALLRWQSSPLGVDFWNWLSQGPITHLQIYPPDQIEPITFPADRFSLMPVIAVNGDTFASSGAWWFDATRTTAVVLDTYDPNRAGGTGTSFPWEWVSTARQEGRLEGWPPIILAGGLRPDNVADAVRIAQPYGVDVSSGVELEGSPGKKDARKMRDFVRNAKSRGL